MTSASKLFHGRRIRFGLRNNTVDDTDSDFSPADRSSYRRTATTNRRHHDLNSRTDRHDLGGCNPPTRRIHRHRLSEHELVQLEQSGTQSPSGSIINSEDFRSIRRLGATGNDDRLPGVVLLARERLLERLRGVHVSENRQISRSSSSIHQDLLSSYSSFIETNNNLVEEPISESWPAVTTRMLPPGLSEDALNCLSMEVFKNDEEEEDDERSTARSRECSICLEAFEDGDELINLGCRHRFHSCCLYPWVEVCGACPNCRKDIVVVTSNNNNNKLVS